MSLPQESPLLQLAALVAAGDERAFERMFETYADRLYRYLDAYVGSRDEAEELVHDVFWRLWQGRTNLKQVRDVEPYLYVMARNRAMDHLRHRRLREKLGRNYVPPALEEGGPAAQPGVERDLAVHEIAAEVRRAVDLLPPRQREVLLRKWQDEASYEDISQAMGISILTVGKHLTRAYDHLRRVLPRLL